MSKVVYTEPYRNLFGCVAANRNAELGKWLELPVALKLHRLGGAFVGYSGTDIVLVNADNTSGKLLGWANRSVDKSKYAAGEQMHILFDNEITFQLPVIYTPATAPAGGWTSWEEEYAANMVEARKVIDAMKFGDVFALKVVADDDGNPIQKVDPAGVAANALVSVVDIDQPGRDYVRVRMIPGKLNMA